MRKPSNNEDKKRFLGHVGFDHRGSSNTVFPSNIIIRGKRLNFMGTCGMVVMKNMEVSSLPSQSPLSSFPSSCGLILPIPSPSVPVLPSSVIQSQFPMENRVISEFFFSKKDDDGTLCQISVGNPNLDVVESQFAYLN